MAYSKDGGGSSSMDSPKGLCSYKSNPLKAAKTTSRQCGLGMNPDQKKANKLLQKAHAEKDSYRGMSGM